MASFETAIPTILSHEGGYVNHPSDPGGATNFGVSLKYLVGVGDLDGDGFKDGDLDHDGDVDGDDIRQMTVEQAKEIYKKQWWDRCNFGLIEDQQVATKLFDTAVNMGTVQANKIIQRALSCCGKPVVVDGKVGPKSFEAINSCDPVCLLFHMRDQQAQFYRSLAVQKPKFQVFLKGWLRRAYS